MFFIERKICLTLLLASICAFSTKGQIYVDNFDGGYEVDLCNCSVSSTPTNSTIIDSYAMAASPNGSIYSFSIDGIVVVPASTGVPVTLGPLPPNFNSICLVYAPNGLLYTVSDPNPLPTLYSINPTTGVFTNLGILPTGFLPEGDLFYYQGQLYCTVANLAGNSSIYQIPINDPANATLVFDFPDLTAMIGSITVIIDGVETVLIYAFDYLSDTYHLFQVDMSTGGYSIYCSQFSGGEDLAAPPNYVVPACCDNFAGNFQTLALSTACQNETITLNHLGDEDLNAGSSLSFVLVADSAATLPDEIIQTSATPTFSFNPATMDPNTTYYVAAVAAPGTAGNPDWLAECIDVGFFAAVEWKAVPTVALVGNAPEICRDGCAEFNLVFTGDFPMVLTWEIDFGSQQSTGTFNANSANALLSVCPTAGGSFPSGAFDLQLTELSNSICTCP